MQEFTQEVEKDGIVRIMDELGSIVIPIETRQAYGIQNIGEATASTLLGCYI